MRTKLLSLLVGVCACVTLAGLFSPNVFGQTLKQVTKFDLPGPGGKRFDYLTIDEDDHYLLSTHLAADQTYVIDLISKEFDAYLVLQDANALTLAQDDDGGGNLNSRIRYQPKTDGRFRLVATTFNGQLGAFTLRVTEQP